MKATAQMIKVSDYLINRLATHYHVEHVFMVVGGGAMHLNDSVGKCREITYICNHHEQASAIAAEGYYRTSAKPGVVMVTSGPGGTNTLTGVIGQWLDSAAVLYISGQVKFETTIESCREIGLRQLGDQEINIIDIVKPVTKFSTMVKDPTQIKRLLDKAIHIATTGRPGPVWLDVPLNVQGAMINEQVLPEYDPKEDETIFDSNDLKLKIRHTIDLLKHSQRPVFIAGHGIRLARAQECFLALIQQIQIPVVSTFNGFDLIPTDHPLYIGRIGTLGDRAGNFALQNSDLVLSVGSRNNIRQISYNWPTFAPAAKKIVVDIDNAELNKPTLIPDIAINVDALDFFILLTDHLKKESLSDHTHWIEWCRERKKRYPVVLPEYKEKKELINPYYFIKVLTEALDNQAFIVAGNGTACVSLFQAGVVKEGQRMFFNSGCASMGYDLPAAIGACMANGRKKVICLAGDGSLQMNIQELNTVVYHQLSIKLFVLNNQGYISIKQTQNSFFNGHHVGCSEASGVGLPDIERIATAYQIPFVRLFRHDEIGKCINEVLQGNNPFICEVMLDPGQFFAPKASSKRLADGRMVSRPLEDMSPFLDRDEFLQNMIIDPDPGSDRNE